MKMLNDFQIYSMAVLRDPLIISYRVIKRTFGMSGFKCVMANGILNGNLFSEFKACAKQFCLLYIWYNHAQDTLTFDLVNMYFECVELKHQVTERTCKLHRER